MCVGGDPQFLSLSGLVGLSFCVCVCFVEHGIPFRWEIAAELFSLWREKDRKRERERE